MTCWSGNPRIESLCTPRHGSEKRPGDAACSCRAVSPARHFGTPHGVRLCHNIMSIEGGIRQPERASGDLVADSPRAHSTARHNGARLCHENVAAWHGHFALPSTLGLNCRPATNHAVSLARSFEIQFGARLCHGNVADKLLFFSDAAQLAMATLICRLVQNDAGLRHLWITVSCT